MQKVTLGDVAVESKETCKKDQSDYPTVGLEHLTPGELSLSRWDENSDTTFTKLFRKGDMLFGRRRAYLKKAAVAPFDGICSGDITVIRALPGKIVPELLPFIIQSEDFFDFAVGHSAGSLSPRVKWEHLKNYRLTLPPLPKQRELAEVLWAIEDTRTAYQRLEQATEELVKSRFIEMFGDAPLSSSMQEACKIITDGTHQPPKFVKTGIPFIFVSNIAHNHLTYDAEKFIDEETYNELIKRTPIEIGDVLLSTVGSYGHPAIVESERKFLFQRHIAYLKPDHDIINSRFLHALILNDAVQRQIESKVKGIAQKTLNLSEIKSLQILLPPLDLQNQFADFVALADKSKVVLQKSVDSLQKLKAELMYKYLG